MDENTVEGGWLLVYRRGIASAIGDLFGIIQAAFIALICVGSLLFVAAYSLGLLHNSYIPAEYGSTDLFPHTFWGRVSEFLILLVTCLLAYSSIGDLLKVFRDMIMRSGIFEGTLERVNERVVNGIHASYPMLELACKGETWEIYPRGLDNKNMLRPGKRIRVLYAAGTRTIKTLWVQNEPARQPE